MVDFVRHDAVIFHLAKLLNQHLLRNSGNGAFKVR